MDLAVLTHLETNFILQIWPLVTQDLANTNDGTTGDRSPNITANFCRIRIAGSRSAIHRAFKYAHLYTMTFSYTLFVTSG
jgi:hypothetical protein